MIQKLSISLRGSGGISLTHDSRQEVRTLSKVCNILIEKVNELTDEVNKLQKRVELLENP